VSRAAGFAGWRMSVETNAGNGPGRRVSIRRDGNDFVVAFQPEDFVIFRNNDPNALRRVCRFLRWDIVSDTVIAVEPGLPSVCALPLNRIPDRGERGEE
jgi:hypothetical protein